MAVFLTVDDLIPFVSDLDAIKAEAMIDDLEAMAVLLAPCITEAGFVQDVAVRAILRGAFVRWYEAGSGALTQRQEQAGPFMLGQSYDTRQQRRGMFWPTEITQLQQLCSEASSGAFAVDTVPASTVVHLDTCSVRFGGDCSCGAILTQGPPLYEWH